MYTLIEECLNIFHWYRLPVKIVERTKDTIKFHSDIKCSLSIISDLRPIAEEHRVLIFLNDLEIDYEI